MSPDPRGAPDPGGAAGAFIMVVGPSGAGKDALLRGAKERLGHDPFVRFARRVVTRAADGSEDNEAATPEDFAAARAAGAFILDWDAHGLSYGVPRAAVAPLAQGVSVVVNGSRGAVAAARARIRPVKVVVVTAPAEVLAARIFARGRNEDAAARLAREAVPPDRLAPDLVIDNSGSLDEAIETFVRFLTEICQLSHL